MSDRKIALYLTSPGPLPMDQILQRMHGRGVPVTWTSMHTNRPHDVENWDMGYIIPPGGDRARDQILLVFARVDDDYRQELIESFGEGEDASFRPLLEQVESAYELTPASHASDRIVAHLADTLLENRSGMVRDAQTGRSFTLSDFRKSQAHLTR